MRLVTLATDHQPSPVASLQRCHTGPEYCFLLGFNCAWGGWDDLSLLVSRKSSYRSGRVSQESLGLFRGDRLLFALAGWICHSARYCWVRPPVKMKHAVETSVLSLFIFYWWFCWLCSPVADRSCAVFLFFRAIMEHKELLKVQWDWQIGKPLILTVFTLGLIAWAETWVEFNHLLPAPTSLFSQCTTDTKKQFYCQ